MSSPVPPAPSSGGGAARRGALAAVITCSNRSAAGARADDSGQLLVDLLEQAGWPVGSKAIVADAVPAIQSAIRSAIDGGARLILTTGGTGLTPTDVTPEAVRPLLEREIPGIAEALRAPAPGRPPAAALSRGVAGAIGAALVVTLPGSPAGARDGMAVLAPLIGHALDQLAGGDHQPGGGMPDGPGHR